MLINKRYLILINNLIKQIKIFISENSPNRHINNYFDINQIYISLFLTDNKNIYKLILKTISQIKILYV